MKSARVEIKVFTSLANSKFFTSGKKRKAEKVKKASKKKKKRHADSDMSDQDQEQEDEQEEVALKQRSSSRKSKKEKVLSILRASFFWCDQRETPFLRFKVRLFESAKDFRVRAVT